MNNYDEALSFFMSTYTLEHTKRYSMKPVVNEESVASHSYFVALGVLIFHRVYAFNLADALSIALVHDLPEIKISDINHKVKKSFPNLGAIIKDVELQVVRSFPSEIERSYRSYAFDEESVESLIVHFIDALQCSQYAQSELSLGNSNMNEVLVNTEHRAEILKAQLEEHKRE